MTPAIAFVDFDGCAEAHRVRCLKRFRVARALASVQGVRSDARGLVLDEAARERMRVWRRKNLSAADAIRIVMHPQMRPAR